MARRAGAGARDGEPLAPGEHLAEVVPLVHGDHAGPFPGPGHGLPSFWSTFVGRSREIHEVATLLRSARLVTLTGAGGMGKTRLAVEVAERVAPGRAFFVDLAPVREPALVGEHIASAFALGELRDRRLADVVAAELTGGALLVLDNCEHLIAACAGLARELLRGCRGLKILATSQQRLGVSGETVWWVPPLALPESLPDVAAGAALQSAAVQLFCERAAAVKRSFVPSGANLEAIVEICRRLDGNPLAIELAAARVDVLSPAQIADRLESRFHLLQGGPGSGPARHQTLGGALEWSHELLGEPERVLLRRLSVFAGGFGLEAVEKVSGWAELERHRALDLLSALVAKSLVVADTSGAVARYRLLETVRHYAAEALAAAGEETETSERHAQWCVELAEHFAETDDEAAALEAMEAEQDNVRAALDWCLAERRVELALRLAAAQMLHWQGSGRFAEARECLARVVAASGPAPTALRATALHDSGFAAFMLGDFEAARADLSASLDLWAEAGDAAAGERTQGLLAFVSTFGDGPNSVDDLEADLEEVRATGTAERLAETLVSCGHARLFRGEAVAAQRHFEELVALARRTGDDPAAANALVGLGTAAVGRGDYGPAEAHLREGVAFAVATGQPHAEAVGMVWLAELARLRGNHAEARDRFEDCLSGARVLGAPYPLATALLGLGRVVLGQGEARAAQPLFEEAAKVAGDGGQIHVLAAALDGLGEVAVALEDAASVRTRFDDALAVAHQCGEKAVAARSTYHLGELARAEGAFAQAASLHHQALSQRHQIDDRPGVADSLEALAGLAAAGDDDEVAARLFGAAQALRDAGGYARPPRRADTYDADVDGLGERMKPDELERAWAEGAALAYEEAVAYATRGRGPRARPDIGPDSLTRTEGEIVTLVAEGLTNPEIGGRLFISPRTVQSHLRKVYAKLGVSSRRELRDALAGRT